MAENLSGRIGADLFEISRKEPYSSLYMQSNSEIRRGARPELSETVSGMEEYDIVFVGYPVWFHATPAPVNTFLESYDLTGKLSSRSVPAAAVIFPRRCPRSWTPARALRCTANSGSVQWERLTVGWRSWIWD